MFAGFVGGGHIASFSKSFVLQVHPDSYGIYAPGSVSIIPEFYLLLELLPPCSFDKTQFQSWDVGFSLLLICCSASGDTDCATPLLDLLLTSKSSEIWRYGL